MDANISPQKKRRRWLSILLYTFVFLTFVALFCGFYATHKARDILVGSGYLESWQEGIDGTTERDVAFGEEPWERLDVFFPTKERRVESRGAVLYIHGGAWAFGQRSDMTGFARRRAKAGYLSATMGYRLFQENDKDSYSIAKILDEVDAALAKYKELALEKGYDIDRVALAGDSAGAHILSLYAYSRGKTAPLPVVFIAPRVAPIDLRADAWDPVQKPKTIAKIASLMTQTNLTEQDVLDPSGDALAAIDSVSPLSFVAKGEFVPTLAAYGGKDPIVGSRHGRKLVEAFQALGSKSIVDVPQDDEQTPIFDYIEYPNSGHMLSKDPERAKEYEDLFTKYLVRYFGSPIPTDDDANDENVKKNDASQESVEETAANEPQTQE